MCFYIFEERIVIKFNFTNSGFALSVVCLSFEIRKAKSAERISIKFYLLSLEYLPTCSTNVCQLFHHIFFKMKK